MPIRITSATGEVVEDHIPNAKGGEGSQQFTKVRFPWVMLIQGSFRAHRQLTPALGDIIKDKILSARGGK